MAWFNFTTQQLKVLIFGKTLKNPGKRLTSGLNLNPKVRKTQHIGGDALFHLKEKSQPRFVVSGLLGPDAHVCGLGPKLVV